MSAHGGGGSERWLVSYADFITLLMVLFVVLYSMGQVDVAKYKALASGLKVAFSGGPVKVVDAGINAGGGGKEQEAAPIIIPGIPQQSVNSTEVAGELTSMLNQAHLGGSVSVQNNIEGVLISLGEKLLFRPGTAELNPEAYPILDTIIHMLLPTENEIRVTGHTDNTPPSDPHYPTNLELSVGRAVVIADYFIQAGIQPQRITVAGRGEYKPIFPNDTAEHRALNSRAEIVIVYAVASDMLKLNTTIPAVGEGNP